MFFVCLEMYQNNIYFLKYILISVCKYDLEKLKKYIK